MGASEQQQLDLNDIPLILALARAGSMSAAARALGVDVSTISRRVAAAESAMNTRLFIRSNRGYEPTDAGAAFVAHAERVVGEVQALQQETRSEAEGIGGLVRITSVNVMFDLWLVDRLPELLARHPLLRVRLLADNQNLSFTRREADFALRLARPTEDAALVMKKVGQVGFAVYGAPRFAKLPRSAWGEQPWLSYNEDLSTLPEMRWLAENIQPPPRGVVQVNSVTTLIHACEAGLGLALLPCMVGARKSLVRLSKRVEISREIWLLSHRDAVKIKRFRAVTDWLTEILDRDRALFTGE
jgi:DNA-binding transcriptional LysR family regulator